MTLSELVAPYDDQESGFTEVRVKLRKLYIR